MTYKILSKYEKCPQCGKARGLFLTRDRIITDFVSLSGKPFVFATEQRRKYKLSGNDFAMIMDCCSDDDPHYMYHCQYCKWHARPYDSDGNDLLMELS